MFGIPAETEFDLRFRLLDIPTRITPFFWVGAAILGGSARDGAAFVLWIVAVLISIMVHEFGHGLTARFFGQAPRVILYQFGGLCAYEPYHEPRPWQRLLIIIMGPMAGFLLFGLVFGGMFLSARFDVPQVLPGMRSFAFRSFVNDLLTINLFWGLLNLLPVYPLDGGQISAILLTLLNRRKGFRWSCIVSLLCGGLVALFLAQREMYMSAIMFGLLAFQSFQTLQALQNQGGYLESDESDADWWKR